MQMQSRIGSLTQRDGELGEIDPGKKIKILQENHDSVLGAIVV
jgi:hypothetical protein